MAEAPSPYLKLTEIPGRGRSLIVSQPGVKAGEILLQDSPLLLYPSSLPLSSPPTFCSRCFRTLSSSSSSLACPSCTTSLFCSPSCLSLALTSSHSPSLCAIFAIIRSASLPKLELITPLIFLATAYNLAASSPPAFRRLLSLEGDPDLADASSAAALHSFFSSLSPPPQTEVGFSLELTAALLAKDRQNAFGLMEPFDGSGERAVRAYGIYPKASFFNHDCLPNACRFDYVDRVGDGNTDMVVRAIHDIDEGREVCLSYFPVNWSYKDRQKRLLEDYGFVCECDRCQVEKNWKENEGDDEDEGCMEGDDEEDVEFMEEEEDNGGGGDFPHAYFFVNYVCERENCGGTLAPLPPSEDGSVSNVMECNVCGQLKTEVDAGGDSSEDGAMVDE
ncbi:hypothetical protein ACLOJK_023880 [Asimina triloba]